MKRESGESPPCLRREPVSAQGGRQHCRGCGGGGRSHEGAGTGGAHRTRLPGDTGQGALPRHAPSPLSLLAPNGSPNGLSSKELFTFPAPSRHLIGRHVTETVLPRCWESGGAELALCSLVGLSTLVGLSMRSGIYRSPYSCSTSTWSEPPATWWASSNNRKPQRPRQVWCPLCPPSHSKQGGPNTAAQ